MFIVLGMVLAIIVAILLNEIKGKVSRNVFQTCILIPYLVSIVVVSYVVNSFLAANTGFVNTHILRPLGIDPVSWYENPQYWPFILTFVNMWQSLGFTTIIYYSSIIGISTDYYEAALSC